MPCHCCVVVYSLKHPNQLIHHQSLGTSPLGLAVTGNPILRTPVQDNDVEEVQKLLAEAEARGEDTSVLVNSPDAFWMSAVLYAAQNGFNNILQILIEHNADVNAPNKVRACTRHAPCLRLAFFAASCMTRYVGPWHAFGPSCCSPTLPLFFSSSARSPSTWRPRWAT